ncbi:hypothetical protein ACWDFH_31940 [Streptomyces kronopolitis]|uniref:hypothetical protein n=1 Tax=Streptomyces kronopolitis TaxID=1612435 RepID=UPI00367DAA16
MELKVRMRRERCTLDAAIGATDEADSEMVAIRPSRVSRPRKRWKSGLELGTGTRPEQIMAGLHGAVERARPAGQW